MSIDAMKCKLGKRDWSLLEATQESLREHMAEIKRLKQRQWVGLTDDDDRAALREMATFMDETDCSHLLSLTEERLKEKNT